MDTCDTDDDDEMFQKSFAYFDKDGDKKISKKELENRIEDLKRHPDLLPCLDRMKKHLNSSTSTEIEFREFKKSFLNIPRVKNHRTEWVRSLHLNEALAKRLHAGVLWDGLKGLKEMTLDQIKAACEDFAADVLVKVTTEWSSLQSDASSPAAGQVCGNGFDDWDAQAVMSKFREDTGAFSGNFADPKLFHEGLESMLGLADPCILRAILREHVLEAECEDGFMPSNYFIYTSPSVEFARLFANEEFVDGVPRFLIDKAKEQDPSYPTTGELNEVKELFQKIQKVQEIINRNRSKVYPGDIGSKILEYQVSFSALLEDAAHFQEVGKEVKKVVSKFAELHEIFKPGEKDLQGLECNCSQKSGAEECNLQFHIILQFGPSKGRDSSRTDSWDMQNLFEGTKRSREKLLNELLTELRNLKHISEIPEDDMIERQEKIYFYCKYKEEKDMKDFIENSNIGKLYFRDMGFTDQFLKSRISDQDQLTSVLNMGCGSRCAEVVKSLGLDGVTEHGIIHLFREESAFLSKHNIVRRQGRRSLALAELMGKVQVLQQVQENEVQQAQENVVPLRFEEVIQQYQYTGPLFQKWNSVLRGLGKSCSSGNKYTTSIHTLVSAVLKTAKATKLPESRKVFRGLGGMVLDDKWFEPDARGAKGGVEIGFLSTTLNRNVALEYSGITKNRGVVLEIDVGAIDCGARLDAVSQYPGEGELLFGPLSNLEALGTRLEMYKEANGDEAKPVVTVSLKINTNLKALTIEEMISKRKKMMTNILQNLREEIIFDLTILELPRVEKELIFEILPLNWHDQVCESLDGPGDQLSASLLPDSEEKDKVKKQIEHVTTIFEKSPVFFNTDSNFVAVFKSALELKQTIITHTVEYYLARVRSALPVATGPTGASRPSSSEAAREGIGSVAGREMEELTEPSVESVLNKAMLKMAVRGRQDLIEILLNSGSKLNHTDQQGRSILHLLCENGHPDVLEFILGKRQKIRQAASVAAVGFVIYFCGSIVYIVVGFLFQRDPVPSWLVGDLNISCDAGLKKNQQQGGQVLSFFGIFTLSICLLYISLFFWGHKLNRSNMIYKVYLQQKKMYDAAMLKLNVTDCDKRTPIHYAAKLGNVEMVRNLIESGASVNVLDKDGRSPLQYFSESPVRPGQERKRADLIKLLQDSGAHHDNVSTAHHDVVRADLHMV